MKSIIDGWIKFWKWQEEQKRKPIDKFQRDYARAVDKEMNSSNDYYWLNR